MKKLNLILILSFLLSSVNLFAAKNLYLSYTKIPDKIYKEQKFEIKIEALITTTNFTNLSTKFSDYSKIEVLNPSSPWRKVSNDKYENSYYFKVKSSNFVLPNFIVSLENSNSTIDTTVINAPNITFSNIGKSDSRFSNIIAENIVVKAYKTRQYNNNDALTIIDLDAINSNLANFHLNGIEEQGISSIKEWENIENLVYYFVTPIFQKNLIFTYFNSSTNSFHEVRIPLILQNELVSTQTDLNPNDSTFEQYKKIAAIAAVIAFLSIFIVTRYKIFLFFTIISLIVAIIYNYPNEKGVLKKDSFVYILPTKNSTIFFKAQKSEEVEVLERRENFIKILGVQTKFVGWIKEESLEKN